MREAVKAVKRHWAFKDKSTTPAPNVPSLPAVGAPLRQRKWEWPLAAGRARFGAWRPRSQQWRRWRCRSKRSQTGKVVFQLVPDAGSHKLWRRIVPRYKGITGMPSPLHHPSRDALQEKCPSAFIVHICGLDFKSTLLNVKELLQQNCAMLCGTYSTKKYDIFQTYNLVQVQ